MLSGLRINGRITDWNTFKFNNQSILKKKAIHTNANKFGKSQQKREDPWTGFIKTRSKV